MTRHHHAPPRPRHPQTADQQITDNRQVSRRYTMHTWRSTAATTGAVAALLTLLAGCGGDGSEAAPIPEVSSTAPTEPTQSPTDTGGPPDGWEDKFTPEQLRAYNAALNRWQRYTELTNEIYRNGKDTPEARATLQEYDFFWQRNIVELAKTYDEGGLRLVNDVEPLWTYATTVRLNEDGTGNVVFVQCTNYEPLKYTRNGEPQRIEKPTHVITPLSITMVKPADHDWMYQETKLKDKTSCAA